MVVGATFLTLMRIASPAGAFGLYAVLCMGSWVFCWICYPETSGWVLLKDWFKKGYGLMIDYRWKRFLYCLNTGMESNNMENEKTARVCEAQSRGYQPQLHYGTFG